MDKELHKFIVAQLLYNHAETTGASTSNQGNHIFLVAKALSNLWPIRESMTAVEDWDKSKNPLVSNSTNKLKTQLQFLKNFFN